jgi:hypothetical protein
MTTPAEKIESFLELKGSANVNDLAAIGNVNYELAKSIADGFVYEGKARSFQNEQDCRTPVYKWAGT